MTAALKRRRTLDREVDRAWRLGLDPVAQAPERAVGCEHDADAAGQRVEGGISAGAGLHDCLDLGAVLVVVAERREGHRGLARFAVAQDQETGRRHALGQDLAAQDWRGLRLQQGVQRREDGFAGGGHVVAPVQYCG